MADNQQRVFPEFYMDSIKDEGASALAGRPIFKDIEMIRYRWAGDKHREHMAPAHDASIRDPGSNRWLSHAERWPREYDAFKRNALYQGSGTPIDEAPFLSNAQRAELKAINIFTIEQLSDPTSQAISRMGPGGYKMAEQAKAYVEKAAGSAPLTALAAENAELKERMANMERMFSDALANRQPSPAPAQAATNDDDEPSSDIFDKWDDESLKAFIKDKTGQTPRGNPSHATLVRMADEAHAKVAA